MNILHVKIDRIYPHLECQFWFLVFSAVLSLLYYHWYSEIPVMAKQASLKWQRTLETTMDTNGFTYDKHTDILVNACTLPYPYGAQ